MEAISKKSIKGQVVGIILVTISFNNSNTKYFTG